MVTRTHFNALARQLDRHRLMMAEWVKWFGPMGIVGPVSSIDKGGIIRPIGRHKGLNPSSAMYATKPIYFFCVELNDSLIFASDVAPCGVWDQSA